ncbi:MAG: hypothetical protein E6J62_07780 [Deltaproteobacteria bacterium]|nr:MAG: hypothetical protein E6J62_07780 [Deltaproteobacteria bacterium]
MRRRVFVVAGEYSANPRHLPPERRKRAFLAEPHPELTDEEVTRLFFRFPNRSEDGRTRPEDWKREFALSAPIGLNDLFASAAHRALTSLYRLTSTDYRATRDSITDLFVTSMPGLDPNERMNIGLVPQALRAALALPPPSSSSQGRSSLLDTPRSTRSGPCSERTTRRAASTCWPSATCSWTPCGATPACRGPR